MGENRFSRGGRVKRNWLSETARNVDRMRPLLRAIEGAAADEQISALTPEYLEARARG